MAIPKSKTDNAILLPDCLLKAAERSGASSMLRELRRPPCFWQECLRKTCHLAVLLRSDEHVKDTKGDRKLQAKGGPAAPAGERRRFMRTPEFNHPAIRRQAMLGQ